MTFMKTEDVIFSVGANMQMCKAENDSMSELWAKKL